MIIELCRYLKFKKALRIAFRTAFESESEYIYKKCIPLLTNFCKKFIPPSVQDFKEEMSENDYQYLVHVVISHFTFDEVISDRHFLISEHLDDVGKALYRIHDKYLKIALENGWITEQQRADDLSALNHEITSFSRFK